MINKSARLILVAAACAKLGTGQRVNSVLHPSRHDIREEQALARERVSGELPQDDDLPALSSSLHFDDTPAAHEGESLLSANERKQVARERAAYRAEMERRYPVNFILVNS